MPIYEFECKYGDKFEMILPLSESGNKVQICHCGALAEKIFSLPANPQIAPSTIIFRNPRTGQVETAHSRNQANPKGMIREELKGPFERSNFEREQQRIHNIENEQVTQRNFAIKDQARKNRHSDINSRMNTVEVNSNENPQLTKDLLKMAMDRSNKKELPHKKTEFHLAVNHQDKNNLDKG